MHLRMQATRTTLAAITVALLAATAAAAEPHYPALLRSECEALVRWSIPKPYGRAWAAADPPPMKLARDAAFVSMEPLATPSAGLVLLWAGRALGDDEYVTAARQAARGLAASQLPNGAFPARAVFGTRASPGDPPSAVHDRAPTCASLALILTVLDDLEEDQYLRRSALKAAGFLAHQQTETGAWTMVDPSSAAARSAAKKVIRLDDPDYRDSTLALLYAYEVLQEASLRRPVEKAAEHLIRLRLERSRTVSGLWHSSYDLANQPIPRPDGTFAIDALASRYALQTLFACHLILGGDSTGAALNDGMNTLAMLRYDGALWDRFYALKNNEHHKAEKPVEPPVFVDPAMLPPLPHGDFGLTATLSSIVQLNRLGRAKYQERLSDSADYKMHLAQTLGGLTDAPLTLDLPMTPEAAKAYIVAHQAEWTALADPLPPDLKGRIRRIHTLMIRCHLDQLLKDRPPVTAPSGE